MKHLIVLFSLAVVFLSGVASAQESIYGVYIKNAGGVFVVSADLRRSYRVKPADETVARQLSRLSSFDSIQGTGYFSGERDLLLTSVDFVGLQELLGAWTAKDMIFYFKNYAEVSLYSPKIDRFSPEQMNYTVTPAAGNQWLIFFSDHNQVTLAGLQIFDGTSAILTFLDQETGAAKSTLSLSKVNRK